MKNMVNRRKSGSEKAQKIRREVGFELILIILLLLPFQLVLVEDYQHITSNALRFILIFYIQLVPA